MSRLPLLVLSLKEKMTRYPFSDLLGEPALTNVHYVSCASLYWLAQEEEEPEDEEERSTQGTKTAGADEGVDDGSEIQMVADDRRGSDASGGIEALHDSVNTSASVLALSSHLPPWWYFASCPRRH